MPRRHRLATFSEAITQAPHLRAGSGALPLADRVGSVSSSGPEINPKGVLQAGDSGEVGPRLAVQHLADKGVVNARLGGDRTCTTPAHRFPEVHGQEACHFPSGITYRNVRPIRRQLPRLRSAMAGHGLMVSRGRASDLRAGMRHNWRLVSPICCVNHRGRTPVQPHSTTQG